MRVVSNFAGSDVEKLADHKANPASNHLHLVNVDGEAVVMVSPASTDGNADVLELTQEQAEHLVAKGFKKHGWAARYVKGEKRAPNKPKEVVQEVPTAG